MTDPAPTEPPASDPFERAVSRERAERRAAKVRRARAGFRAHLNVYLAVNLLLVAIWAATAFTGDAEDGRHPWFLYPALGWGIGLYFHWWATRDRSAV